MILKYSPPHKGTIKREASEMDPKTTAEASVLLSENNMDTPVHQELYAKGYEMRKKVVGEEYVANSLEKGKSDFLRPLQQFATVSGFAYFSGLHSLS